MKTGCLTNSRSEPGFVGSDGREASSAIQNALRERKIPIAISNASRDGNQVVAHIEVPAADQNPHGGRGILYVAVADNRAESHVARGENAGRSLAHVGVNANSQASGNDRSQQWLGQGSRADGSTGGRGERIARCGVHSGPQNGPHPGRGSAEALGSRKEHVT
jgi:hypothetical protein